jgi:bifunctional non-homologous end joining protein LigD
MRDLFNDKSVSPMLIAEQQDPFNSLDYIYEFKFDGYRCIAYLDEEADIRSRQNNPLIKKFPELAMLHEQVTDRCILDGELVVFKNGAPDFYELRRRSLMTNEFKIGLASKQFPATYIAYDILYYKGESVTNLPLLERKQILQNVVTENDRILISRYIEECGVQLFDIAKENKLEGIVAKRKDSRYELGKRSRFWIKCKVSNAIDAVVCGYLRKKDGMISIIIGQYDGTELIYKGHVTLGAGMAHIRKHGYTTMDNSPFGYVPRGSEGAVWIMPDIVCTIEYMTSEKEAMRLAVFRGIREDKSPQECQVDE